MSLLKEKVHQTRFETDTPSLSFVCVVIHSVPDTRTPQRRGVHRRDETCVRRVPTGTPTTEDHSEPRPRALVTRRPTPLPDSSPSLRHPEPPLKVNLFIPVSDQRNTLEVQSVF